MSSPSPKNIDRRHFIRTAAGVFALPWMESFVGGKLIAAATKSVPSPPVRFLTLFFPNGVYPAAWEAKQVAEGLSFNGSLAPLQRFADKSVVITGLNNPLGGHLGQTSGFLSGIDFAPDEDGVVKGGVSLDQMLARQWADETFVPSLNLALEPPSQGGFGNRPRSFGNSISWSSPTSKVEPQLNPQQAFDQVFFGQTEAGRRLAGRRKRIVDEIWGQAKALERRVSSFDRQKLVQYLDSIRDLEAKLAKSVDPNRRQRIPSDESFAMRPEKSGIPLSHEAHLKLMMEVMLLAMQTDSTRVGTMVMGHSISRVVYDFLDSQLTRNHHDYSHHRNDPSKIEGYNAITTWFAAQCAWVLERMDSIDEGNGSLLDNSVVLYGSGMKDGNVHEPVDVPVALFGGAGGRLQTGRKISCPEDSLLAQLHFSLLQMFGLEVDSFNGVTEKGVSGLV